MANLEPGIKENAANIGAQIASSEKPDFEKHADQKREEQLEWENTQTNIGKSTPESSDAPSSILASAVADRKKSSQSLDKRKKQAAYDALILEMYYRLRLLNEQLQDYTERFEVVTNHVEALSSVIEQINDGEEYLNNDGTLKDERAELALKEYEEKYGVEVDRYDPLAIQTVLARYEQEQIELQQKIQKTTNDIQDIHTEAKQKFGDNAPALIEAAGKANLSVTEKVTIDLGASFLNSAQDKENAVEARKYTSKGEAMYKESMLLDDDFATMVTVGEDNPFAKGEMKGSFGQAASKVALNDMDNSPFQPTETKNDFNFS